MQKVRLSPLQSEIFRYMVNQAQRRTSCNVHAHTSAIRELEQENIANVEDAMDELEALGVIRCEDRALGGDTSWILTEHGKVVGAEIDPSVSKRIITHLQENWKWWLGTLIAAITAYAAIVTAHM